MKTTILTMAIALALSLSVPAAAKVTAQQKCDSLKLTASAKLAQCRLVALAKHEKKPDETRRDEAFAKCESKFQTVYDKAELKAPEDTAAEQRDQCSTYGNAESIATYLSTSADTVRGLIGSSVSETPRLVSGEDFICWLASNGGVWCLGSGDYGQLGDGLFADSADVAVQPVGLDSGVVAIAAGEQHACAIKDDASLWCWGENNDGQIGDGTTVNAGSPVEVQASEVEIVRVGLGEEHSCAVDNAGGTYCWGQNSDGQVGIGTNDAKVLVPTLVASLTVPMHDVRAGDNFTCALSQSGSVACWGQGDSGRLGNGSDAESLAPVWVTGLSDGNVTQLEVGWSSSCAAVQGGSLYCWGRNNVGQLGIGTTEDSNVPVEVTALGSGVRAFSSGYRNVCAIDADGALYCWGSNSYGALGDGSEEDSSTPMRVGGVLAYAGDPGYATITEVDVGGTNISCAVTDTDDRLCWGKIPISEEGSSWTTAAFPLRIQPFVDVDPF